MAQFSIYLAVAPVAALLTLGALVISMLQRKREKSIFLEAFLLCSTMILVLSFFELIETDEARILILSHWTYVFIAFGPVCWFLFALQYGLGRRPRSHLGLLSLFLIPAITSLLAFADERLHLIWEARGLLSVGLLKINLVKSYGPWFWIHCAYSYLLFLVGGVIILKEFFDHFALYRRQAYLIIGGTAVPLLMNAVYVFRLFPGLRRDFSPIALALSGILFSVSILKFRLLELNPLPRRKWDELIEEGILILNGEGRVVDSNRAASRLLGRPSEGLIGAQLKEVLPECAALLGDGGACEAKVVEGLAAVPEKGTALAFRYRPLSGEAGEGASITLKPTAPPEALEPAGPSGAGSSEPDPLSSLSRREGEVAKLLASELSIKQIAAILYISPNTVKTHERHVLKKLGVQDRQALAKFLESRGGKS